MKREEVMLHLNRIFNQLVEKFGPHEAISMFEETLELPRVIHGKKKKEVKKSNG